MNVSRRTETGLLNPHEALNTQIIYATSAGSKASYAYEALLDTFEGAVIDPSHYFNIGLDYRIPVMHGLIDKNYVQQLKLSPSYDERTFAAEYLGVWQGGAEDSWFDFDKLLKYRRIKNPEWHQKYINDPNIFYIISCDIARVVGGDQSVACVFRINVKNNHFYST